ncbi:MAG: hypothetical protein KBF25_09665, partial [Chitinophagaceae bacterium]|nr:hypothetical protein [Chitinophagaceae bacterium]
MKFILQLFLGLFLLATSTGMSAQQVFGQQEQDMKTIQQWINSSAQSPVLSADSIRFFSHFESQGQKSGVARKMFSVFRVIYNSEISVPDRIRFCQYLIRTYSDEVLMPLSMIQEQLSVLL